MRITLSSVLVDDQEKALRFYTDVLGFVTKHDIPMGPARWLTVVSSDGSPDIELVLEPDQHPAAKAFKQAIFADGIPMTSFECRDVDAEYARLTALGVKFRRPPTQTGPVKTAILDDTCGNLIQLHQPPA